MIHGNGGDVTAVRDVQRESALRGHLLRRQAFPVQESRQDAVLRDRHPEDSPASGDADEPVRAA